MKALWALLPYLAACGGGERQRIVLVTLDTLRADALAQMPATAAFAARGAVFERAYSATSTTQPTHVSLLTGLHPWQHGVTQNGEVLGEERTTVAELLAAEGYATGAVVASFPLERRFGFAQGFEQFRDEFQVPLGVQQWEGEDIEDGRFYSLGESVTDEALLLLEQLEGERQFLWVHYYDAHDPYGDAAGAPDAMPVGALLQAGSERRPDTGPLVEHARELYERDLAALDRALGRLLARLAREDGFATHVVITADHGESLGEGGSVGHGKRLLPEQVHVPLVIVSPRVAAGRRSDTTGSVDVATTLLSLAGLARGASHGRDLLATPPDRTLALGMRRNFAESKPEQLLDGRQLPVDGTRFFVARDGRLFTGDAELAFLDDDLARVLTEEPLASDLRASFTGFQAMLDGTSVEVLQDDEVRRALGALGYGSFDVEPATGSKPR